MLRLFLLAWLSTSILVSTGDLFAGKILYDDFSSGDLDGDKWIQRIYVREVIGGKFVSKLGNRSPDMGAEFAPGLFMNSLEINRDNVDIDAIHSIECDITVTASKLDSAPGSQSYARIGGIFYSANPTGGGTGDIWAELGIGDRGNGGLEVFAIVAEFQDDNYQSWNFVGDVTLIGPLSNLNYPVTYTLKLVYDGSNGFEFWANGSRTSLTGPEYRDVSYGKNKQLETIIKATDGDNNGYIAAQFDNVYLNNQPTVYDDFTADRIDTAKWENKEWIREVTDGYLRAAIPGAGSNKTVNTVLTVKDTPYLEAKVLIDSRTQLSSGARGIGRIQGYYFNDSQSPGETTKYAGDYFVQVRLRYDGDGRRSADVFVDRTDNPDETEWTLKFAYTFPVTIELDTYYTLFIWYLEKDRKFIFGCGDETVHWEIPSDIKTIYPAYGEHRLLRSRVYLDSGETGFIKARFDDVYIEKKNKMNPAVPFLLLMDK